jgi:acyl-CoA reductase-like NAD-dependent aldehyde dehydrogenase
MRHYELLIGGNFVGGPCDQSVGKITSRNPFNGQTIGTAAEASLTEALAAADAAHDAYQTWKDSVRQQRGEVLSAIRDRIRENADELAALLVLEIGKPMTWARAEVDRTSTTFGLAAEAAFLMTPEEIDVSYDPRAMGHTVIATRFPLGPILCITPYNWPLNLLAHKVAPALASGNTVVVKGSELAPMSTLALARLIHEAGCPAGVANIIVADARTTERLAASPKISMISFTGSPEVGWGIKRAHPERRVVLELGGIAFAIVSDDAGIESAVAKLALSAYGYAGQVCISTQHILVHESVYEVFKTAFVAATESCPTGDPSDRSVVCGPMISEQAAQRVEKAIHEAVASGARLLAGGSRSGSMVQPTVLEAVPRSASLSSCEIFGPVATLEPYSDLDSAISRVNESEFGLQAAVFTQRAEAVQECYRKLEVGSVIVNEPPSLRFDAMPYGGIKRSGFGREGIRYAIAEMTEWKTLVRL